MKHTLWSMCHSRLQTNHFVLNMEAGVIIFKNRTFFNFVEITLLYEFFLEIFETTALSETQ